MASPSLLLCLLFVAYVAATEVLQCPNGPTPNSVEISDCPKSPCLLKRGTNKSVSITFTPTKNIKDLIAHVEANIGGVVSPFPGFDGTSVCDKIQTEDGQKASCPLKAGTRYVYKDSFQVFKSYPKVEPIVHWALQDGNKDVVCFEMPSRIK
nr:venom protein U-MPTX.6-Mc26 [Megalopyge crispata]